MISKRSNGPTLLTLVVALLAILLTGCARDECISSETMSCQCGRAEGEMECVDGLWSDVCVCPETEEFLQVCLDFVSKCHECSPDSFCSISCHEHADHTDWYFGDNWTDCYECTLARIESDRCYLGLSCEEFDETYNSVPSEANHCQAETLHERSLCDDC